MKKFFASLAVGLPVTFLGLILLTGSVDIAFCIFLVGLIVTFGLALIVPWAVGAAILAFVGLFINIPDRKEEAPAKRPLLSRDEVALTEYIKQAEARDMSHDEISDRLHQQGWEVDIIAGAFRILAKVLISL